MSSQEPPFEQPGEEPPPEEQPGDEREVHEVPRERPQSEFAAPQTPPPGYPPPGYAPPQGYPPPGYIPPQGYPPPPQGYAPPPGYYAGPAYAGPRRRRGPWFGCLIALIIILFLCAGLTALGTILGFGFGVGGAFRNSVTEPIRTFSVSASPALILSSDAGSITINRGDTQSIGIQATKFAGFGGNINDVQVNYTQSGSTVNVTVSRSGQFNFFNSTSVDFTITVPPTTDLQITTNAGSIHVSGISGKMSLKTNAGTIGATQASLTGSSTLSTNAGSINFDGSIGTTGTYDFETNAGSIDMTLHGAASFHVNAMTDVGSINTNFPVPVNRSATGATANGDVGTAPQATLTLKTNAGSITLNSGS
jgi:putative adhesin